MIHVYTGNGKGKTTAAVGLAARALGAGLRVCVIQFLKGSTAYNETKLLKKITGKYKVIKFKQVHPMFCSKRNQSIAATKLKGQAMKDFQTAKEIICSSKYDVIVMDEVINLVNQNFVPEAELLKLINEKPKKIELVLTGRGASKKLIDKADYVTEMCLIKHPYTKGAKARKGIEY